MHSVRYQEVIFFQIRPPPKHITDDDRPNTKRVFLATLSRRQPDYGPRLGLAPHLLHGPAAAGRRGAVDITLRTARTGKLESVFKLHRFVMRCCGCCCDGINS